MLYKPQIHDSYTITFVEQSVLTALIPVKITGLTNETHKLTFKHDPSLSEIIPVTPFFSICNVHSK